jgi:hypothetical protein
MLLACSEREEEIAKRGNINASALELLDTFSEKKASLGCDHRFGHNLSSSGFASVF